MDSEIAKRMKEVEKAVLQLDASVRSAAFTMMQDYILGGTVAGSSDTPLDPGGRRGAKPRAKATDKTGAPKVVPPDGFNAFIDQFESDTPHENAKAIAAHLYREYGAEPFTIDEVRELARTGGATIPARIDMTFVQAKQEKRKLFKRAGKGKFRPTVHGEAYFKETYGVKGGARKRPEPEP